MRAANRRGLPLPVRQEPRAVERLDVGRQVLAVVGVNDPPQTPEGPAELLLRGRLVRCGYRGWRSFLRSIVLYGPQCLERSR